MGAKAKEGQSNRTKSNVKNYSLTWLLAAVFGTGGAGTVWLSQNGELSRVRGQNDDLVAKKADLANELAMIKAELARERSEHTLCGRSLAELQSQGSRCSGNATVSGSQGVAINGSTVTTGPTASKTP
jgi:hypothetical protein